MKYYSVVIPYTDKNPTIWHPCDATGAFSVITRGCFRTTEQAHQWATEHIPGHAYSVADYDDSWIDEY